MVNDMAADDKTPKPPRQANDKIRGRGEAARIIFRNHQAQVEPDAGFVARVASELDRRPVDLMSGVALKLLPGTLALLLILAWFASRPPQPSANASVTSSDDLLVWVLDDSEVEP